MNEHYFKNKVKTVSGAAYTLATLLLLASVGGAMTWSWLRKSYGEDYSSAGVFGLLAGVCVFALFAFIILYRACDYVVTDNEIRFVKGGKVFRTIPYAGRSISSCVVSVNGIKTTYALDVEDEKGKKRYVIGLGKKDFDRFVSLVFGYQRQADGAEGEDGRDDS